VLHRYTFERLPELARFITRNLAFVSHVALMGLELMGYVKMNLAALWIDPVEYQRQLCDAVAELEQGRVHTSVYNLPLCLLDRSLWRHAVKSISDWKNEFVEECEKCSVQGACAGVFSSNIPKMSPNIRAVRLSDLAQSEQEQYARSGFHSSG